MYISVVDRQLEQTKNMMEKTTTMFDWVVFFDTADQNTESCKQSLLLKDKR